MHMPYYFDMQYGKIYSCVAKNASALSNVRRFCLTGCGKQSFVCQSDEAKAKKEAERELLSASGTHSRSEFQYLSEPAFVRPLFRNPRMPFQ